MQLRSLLSNNRLIINFPAVLNNDRGESVFALHKTKSPDGKWDDILFSSLGHLRKFWHPVLVDGLLVLLVLNNFLVTKNAYFSKDSMIIFNKN
jgi:hypothetical protein